MSTYRWPVSELVSLVVERTVRAVDHDIAMGPAVRFHEIQDDPHLVARGMVVTEHHPRFGDFDLTSLRTGLMAGAPCPIEVMKRVMTDMHATEVCIAYGMTETAPVSFATNPHDDVERRVTTVGTVLPHVEAKIIDPVTGATAAIGTPGEICTRGYLVMPGYWEDEQGTAEAIDENNLPLADAITNSLQPDPSGGDPSVAHVIGVSMGVLDTWHTDPHVLGGLRTVRVPAWEKHARTAATDVLALARKGRAFDSIGSLHRRHDGLTILHGGILAVTGTLQAWAGHENTTVGDLGATVLPET